MPRIDVDGLADITNSYHPCTWHAPSPGPPRPFVPASAKAVYRASAASSRGANGRERRLSSSPLAGGRLTWWTCYTRWCRKTKQPPRALCRALAFKTMLPEEEARRRTVPYHRVPPICGLDVNATNQSSWTHLLCALAPTFAGGHSKRKTQVNAIQAANFFLSRGAMPNSVAAEGWTALHCMGRYPTSTPHPTRRRWRKSYWRREIFLRRI